MRAGERHFRRLFFGIFLFCSFRFSSLPLTVDDQVCSAFVLFVLLVVVSYLFDYLLPRYSVATKRKKKLKLKRKGSQEERNTMKIYPLTAGAGAEASNAVGSKGDDRKILISSLSPQNGALRRSAVDGNKIRSRLLSRLGIVQKQEANASAAASARLVPMMRKVALLSEPLKYKAEDNCEVEEDDEDEDLKQCGTSCSSNSTTSTAGSSTRSRRSVVAFDDNVSVVPIPKHQEYSNRIRSRLWCDRRELRSMAARNTIEYQAEGWHPSTVIEDEGFITMSTGERIHPVHFQRLLCSPLFSQSFH